MTLDKAIRKVMDGETVTCSSLSIIGMKVALGKYQDDTDDISICLIDSTGSTGPYVPSQDSGLFDDDWEVV